MPVKITIPESRQVTKRFVDSFNELRYLKLVQTKKEFCEAVGLAGTSNLNRMAVNGSKSEPTITNILLLNQKYNVSIEWVMLGKGSVISEVKR
ncbi:hypothetical protein [Dysgonomonas sp. ZJ709]|uniref:hypothetical protein n=1 Tax=Dysgonomonas sp. ZJ709 TaxID=2709797 RepID=UPI0013EB71F5|nr:hypothetical protein [Dysgonomonas sp. ZJ709]